MPTSVELESSVWITQIASELRTLHQVVLPAIDGLPDDREPQGVAHTFGQRLLGLYNGTAELAVPLG